jgi:hypothetical protein
MPNSIHASRKPLPKALQQGSSRIVKVYIQREGGQFSNINYLTAYLGFREFGYDVELYCWDEFDELPITRETIVSGGIPVVLKALARLGRPAPFLDAIPASIAEFAGRSSWSSTMAEVRSQFAAPDAIPVFFKPLPHDTKLFNGTLARRFRDLIATAHLPPTLPVLCASVVDFVSEYRVFILHGEAIGCRHYKGDFRLFPDFSVVDAAIAKFTESPAACAMDFGVTRDGRTLLVEVNDGYALGCYGLNEVRYAKMIEARWRELVGLPQS